MTAVRGDARAPGGAPAPAPLVDVVVIGGGPAGLSAALNLGRARASVIVVDAGRPRNAATLRSHGFLTRDGIPPIELRKLAHLELAEYPDVRVLDRTTVTEVRATDAADGIRFEIALAGRAAKTTPLVRTRTVIVATGLHETLPDVPGIRSFYGMSLFSCAACDAWELQGQRLALIGETPDLAERARLIARWSEHLTVFTNAAPVVEAADEAELAARGIAVERRPVADLAGERGAIRAVVLDGGDRVEVDGGFVRPDWEPALDFLTGIDVDRDADGHLVTDRSGRTSAAGLYSAGDAASGAQQLIVAAGQGARVAAVLVHDLVGVTTAH